MSAILSADDLNDFILPGVACIKPPVSITPADAGEVEIQIDSQGKPLAIEAIDEKATELAPAQISLADCLACSGCITSAEEVLVAQHSHSQIKLALKDDSMVFVASISPQARALLAEAWDCTIPQIDATLIKSLSHLGFAYVVGTGIGRKVLLMYEASTTKEKKPTLCSVCPGWVLYAEKTHPETLPYILTVKLAQLITGAMIKPIVARERNIDVQKVYHMTIMPCFDKKLEAARADNAGEVDGVITLKELIMLFDEMLIDIELVRNIAPNYEKYTPKEFPVWSWLSDVGSVLGGYAINFLRAKQQLLVRSGHDVSNFSVVLIQGKNSDVYELRLLYSGDKVALAAVVNGFRNIQNLVRRLKGPKRGNALAARRRARVGNESVGDSADASTCDYVEIMACPLGCINGGGQILAPDLVSSKEWIEMATQLYGQIEKFDAIDHDDQVASLFDRFCQLYKVDANLVVYTSFKAVEKATPSLATPW